MLAACAPWFNIPRDQADSAGMLAHLHAYFVDGDLLYDDEYARLGMSPLFAFVTSEGVVSNHWPAGAAWLQLPGYALGVSAARCLEALGVTRSTSPVGVVVVLACRAWACLVLCWLARAFALRVATAAGVRLRVGVAVSAAFVLGTPLLYYAVESPLRPHLWGAACVMALVHVWMEPDIAADRPMARTLLLALLAGLAANVRPQLAPLALLVVHDLWTRRARGPVARPLAVAALGLAAWPLLHLRTQLWMYGGSLSDYASEVTVHLGHLLLSPHHGMLTWCPALVVAFFAVGRAAWRRQRGAVLIAVLVVHQIWLDAGMRPIAAESVLGTRTWAGGTGFAARKLVDVLPLLIPAVASLVSAGARARWGRPVLAATGLLCIPTILLHAAAFVAPDATTGALIGSVDALVQVMQRPLSWAAWSTAAAQRQLPFSVTAVVSGVVTLPLLLAAWRVAVAMDRATPSVRVTLLCAALVGGAVASHAWLSVMQIRSDAALVDDPKRIEAIKPGMNAAHRATVAQIPAHHARMREVLGEGAAP